METMTVANTENTVSTTNGDTSKFDIRARALVTSIHIGMWSAKKHDREVTYTATQSYEASTEAGKFTKRLAIDDLLDKIQAKKMEAYMYHVHKTVAWTNRNVRLLDANTYFTYSTDMRRFHDEYMALVDEFVPAYPTIIENAKRHLGRMFKATDYPAPYAIRREFAFEVSIGPITDASHLCVKLSSEQIADIEAGMVAEAQAGIDNARYDLAVRIRAAVAKMAERLDGELNDKGKVKSFKDSMVENLREICAMIPALNVTSDKRIDDIRTEIEDKLLRFSPDTLRDNKHAKSMTHQEAELLLQTIDSYIVKK